MFGEARETIRSSAPKDQYHSPGRRANMELLVLVLNAGMASADLAATLDKLKEQSKSIGAHKKRQLFWDAYTKMASKANNLADGTFCFFKYSADTSKDDAEGDVEVVELTKRQKGMVSGGGVDVLGPKFKPPEDPSSKTVAYAWMEDAAQTAWDDLMHGEPCIYITPDAVWVGTRHKRAMCKAVGSPLKSLKDVEKLIAELKPDAPLRSVSFHGNEPPGVNAYNVFLAGSFKLDGPLPSTIGVVNTTSTNEMYDYFAQRKNTSNVEDANRLIATMLADVGKGLTPLICASSTKEASVAYKSALMKKIYLHKSMKKFIAKAKEDGQVEVCVIEGDDESKMGAFAQYGKLVFEMFYRCDLTTMGA